MRKKYDWIKYILDDLIVYSQEEGLEKLREQLEDVTDKCFASKVDRAKNNIFPLHSQFEKSSKPH